MKGLPWILAGIGVGIAVTFVLFFNQLEDEPEPAYDIGYDGFTDAARKTFAWGTRKQSEGKVSSFAGANNQRTGKVGSAVGVVKQGAGNQRTGNQGTAKLTGNQNLTAESAAGNVKDTAGRVSESAGQILHELN